MRFETFPCPSPESPKETESWTPEELVEQPKEVEFQVPEEFVEQPDQLCALDHGRIIYPAGVNPKNITAVYLGPDGKWYVSTRPEIKKEMEIWQ